MCDESPLDRPVKGSVLFARSDLYREMKEACAEIFTGANRHGRWYAAVHYCVEPFANDGSPLSVIVKSIKRAMAGEYGCEPRSSRFTRVARPLLPAGSHLLPDHRQHFRTLHVHPQRASPVGDGAAAAPELDNERA